MNHTLRRYRHIAAWLHARGFHRLGNMYYDLAAATWQNELAQIDKMRKRINA